MSDTTPGFVTVAAACRRIGISKPHGSKLVKAGAFPLELVPVGFRRMVRTVDLEQFCNPAASAASPDAPVGTGRRSDRTEPDSAPVSPPLGDPVGSTHNDNDARLQPSAVSDQPDGLLSGSRRAG